MGNSHLFPVGKAWIDEPADLEATFLCAPGGGLGALTVSNGRLKAEGRLRHTMLKTTGVAEARVDEFDAFVLVGLQFGVNRCARLFATHRPWRTVQPEPDAVDERHLASPRFPIAAAQNGLRRTVALRLVRRLRDVTPAPILVVAQPGLSERVLECDLKPSRELRELCAQGREGEVRTTYAQAGELLPERFEIVEQPAETIAQEIFTLGRYDCWNPRKGSIDFFDISHMNVEYGRLALRDLRDRLLG